MRIIVKYLLVICIFINIFTVKVNALDNSIKNINFKRITIEDGLSQTTVMYVFQDSEGYMWFGTNDGLNKYDGNKFTVYRSNASNDNSIVSNYISCITEDKNQNLWIGTSNGVSKIDKKNMKITNYSYGKDQGNLSNYNVCEIMVDSKNRVWVATVDGLNKYDENEDKFNRILYSDKNEILTSQRIFSVVEDSLGKIWIGTNEGLNCYDEKTGEVKQIKYNENDENSISGNNIYDLYIDGDDLYIATIESGLTKLNTKTGVVKNYLHDGNDPNALPGDEVTCLLRDNKGRLWIGTNAGLVLFDEEHDKFITYSSKIYDTTSLINDNVYSLFQDKSGMIWVGTIDGISMFNPESIFITYRNDPFNDNTIVNNMVQGVYVDKNGLIWVGGKGSGISVIDRANNKVHRYSNQQQKEKFFTSDKITCINGNERYIWIGTENGLNKIDLKTKKITHHLTNTKNPLSTVIRDIELDSRGYLWVGTKSGLFTINIENDEVINRDDIINNGNVNDFVVASIFEDSQGFIWIGLSIDGGLIRYNPITEEIIQYKHNKEKNNTISNNAIKDITEDSEGNIWIGTNSGLNKYDKITNEFTRYSEVDGLSNGYVYSILIDEQDNPWVSTNYGISKYDISINKFINFNINDGLQANEFNFNSHYKSEDGEMFFGGIRGLTSFYPNDLINNNYLSEVKIRDVEIDGHSISIDHEIYMKFNENILNIKFFMPDYRNTKNIEYAYKLEGLNKEWIYAEDTNYISYNSLPAGKYKLLVVARNPYGNWSNTTSIDIIKEQAPWKTPQAIFLYIFIIIIIIFIIWNRMKILEGIIKQRTYELDKKLKKNERLYKKIIENEKSKNNYFINLSHELRTPLNVILSVEQLITVLNNNDEPIDRSKIKHYMEVLRSNSKRLLKLINDIIDTSKIESGTYKLNIDNHDIIYYVEEVALSMKDFIESNNLELIIDPKIEEKIIQCDIDDIQKCLVNIIGNAVKFTPPGGKIEINVEDFKNCVKISISDTGIGIDEKNINEIFNRFGQAYTKKSEEFGGSGIGLELTKQLILLHKGDLLVKSEVGVGSTFTIILPINQEN